ncbi:hypothetical protein TWF694_011019 [Orbilia ellipsospora]|uniref:Kinesin light chain n=1 Tax=Orbilia ellipsospora TaxID=2528407 RepID=A0AAV9X8X9_9PEZI
MIDHPSTLETFNDEAGVFDSQGKYKVAMQSYERALAGREKILGRDHPSTLETVNSIAMVFHHQSIQSAIKCLFVPFHGIAVLPLTMEDSCNVVDYTKC